MALADKAAAYRRIVELFENDADTCGDLLASLWSLGVAEFSDFRNAWAAVLGLTPEKVFLQRSLQGRSVLAAGLGVEGKIGSGSAAGLEVASAAGAGMQAGAGPSSVQAGGSMAAGPGPWGMMATMGNTSKTSSCVTSQSASKISDESLQLLREELNVVLLPCYGDPSRKCLIKGRPGDTANIDTPWDADIMEDKQSEKAMTQIKKGIAELTARSTELRPQQVKWCNGCSITLRRCFGELPFKVSCKNDEVLVINSYDDGDVLGAVLGLELKKRLTLQGFRQAEVEFYLWQCNSQYPFCQIITDATNGGMAFYCGAVDDMGRKQVHYQVLEGMQNVYIFMAELIDGLPDNLNGRLRCNSDLPVPVPCKFSHPSRIKPQFGHSAGVRQPQEAMGPDTMPPDAKVMKLLSAMQMEDEDDYDDVANMDDLVGF
ncbi:hypothetical protein Vafri_9358 [Volvox africanus]|uniref:Uncharacterized protein n=1 Tax=Volvox africanus TaxID=51714 RepID=A0A8J4B468_9CHLO|nr:hypothetical protein Vafri_9358 [Volvox africanus]